MAQTYHQLRLDLAAALAVFLDPEEAHAESAPVVRGGTGPAPGAWMVAHGTEVVPAEVRRQVSAWVRRRRTGGALGLHPGLEPLPGPPLQGHPRHPDPPAGDRTAGGGGPGGGTAAEGGSLRGCGHRQRHHRRQPGPGDGLAGDGLGSEPRGPGRGPGECRAAWGRPVQFHRGQPPGSGARIRWAWWWRTCPMWILPTSRASSGNWPSNRPRPSLPRIGGWPCPTALLAQARDAEGPGLSPGDRGGPGGRVVPAGHGHRMEQSHDSSRFCGP